MLPCLAWCLKRQNMLRVRILERQHSETAVKDVTLIYRESARRDGSAAPGAKHETWRSGWQELQVVADRAGLGLAVKEKRKNRKLHSSQRKGLTNNTAKSLFSTTPMRRDFRMYSLPHCGQRIMAASAAIRSRPDYLVC